MVEIADREMRAPGLEELATRALLTDLQLDYAYGIDTRDWARYRSVFSDTVEFDFSAWHGGEPMRLDADSWVEQVRNRQSGFDGSQHLMSNFRFSIDQGAAIGITYVVARHYLRMGDEHHVQAIGGYYRNHYVHTSMGWKIDACQLNVLWTEGDRDLFRLAAERWAARQPAVPK
ncbi:MAG: nuclear transport factor 2 family protein [Steroidobacteraceae bacterium]